jgi:hypothetical protein
MDVLALRQSFVPTANAYSHHAFSSKKSGSENNVVRSISAGAGRPATTARLSVIVEDPSASTEDRLVGITVDPSPMWHLDLGDETQMWIF